MFPFSLSGNSFQYRLVPTISTILMDGYFHLFHPSPPPFLFQPPDESSGESEAEELKRALIRATLELEHTRAAAQDELRQMESRTLHLSSLLAAATRERDEARAHCHSLLLLLLNPHQPPNPNPALATHQIADDGSSRASEEEEEEGSNNLGASPPPVTAAEVELEAAAERRGLPEKGRLLEAVVRAGPLLQTLLLAGPLPQWRHPPPLLQSIEVPPVSILSSPAPAARNWGNNASTSPDSSGGGKCHKMGPFRA